MTAPSRPRPSAPDAAGEPERSVLPAIECDPLASLSPTTVTVDYLGREYTVAAMSATQWLAILWNPDFSPDDIFPALVSAEDDVVDGIILGETVTREVFLVAMEILEVASGFRWWFTLRAVAMLRASWFRIGGFVVLDPAQVSLGLFLTSMLGQCIEHMEPARAAEMVEQLNEAPEGFELPEDEFAEGAAFMAAMQSL